MGRFSASAGVISADPVEQAASESELSSYRGDRLVLPASPTP